MKNVHAVSSGESTGLPAGRMVAAAVGAIGLGLATWPVSLLAGAVIDSSWGRTPQTLSGNFVVPEASGKVAGSNLFHSFQKFGIGVGESATFTTSTATLQNVISRVTGKQASSINGPLSLQAAEGSAPNFFFINPNGVTFGPGAQVNVPAAFHVSAASNLNFSDGTVFRAGAGPDNTLTVAAPESFGFLGNNGKVAFSRVQADGSVGHPAFVASSLDLTAADILLVDSPISIRSADVRLAATGSHSIDVPVTGAQIADSDGRVVLNRSALDSSNTAFKDAGDISIYAHEVRINDSVLRADSTSDLRRAGDLTIESNRTYVTGQSMFSARGNLQSIGLGVISIRGRDAVAMAGDSEAPITITTDLGDRHPNGPKGLILIEGGAVSLKNAKLSSVSSESSSGRVSILSTGNLILETTAIDVRGAMGGGSAGQIALESMGGDVSIVDSTLDASKPATPFTGSAGAIEIHALGKVSLHDSHLLATGGQSNPGGSIAIDSSQIVARDNSRISVSHLGVESPRFTFRSGRVGSIELVASKGISIDATSSIEARNAALNTDDPDQIQPGKIRLTTPKLLLDGTLSTESTGNLPASPIVIESPLAASGARSDLAISSTNGLGRIDAGVSSPDATCVGCGSGRAGSVRIEAGRLSLSGVNVLSEAGSGTTGQGGSIAINANGAASIDRARIAADSAGQAAAGSVAVSADDTLKLRDSTVSADAQMSDGGSISLNAGRTLYLDNSLVSASASGVAGNAGAINVNARTLALSTGFIQANTVAAGGFGGAITITTNALLPNGTLAIGDATPVVFQPGLGLSVIQAAAPNGMPGTIIVTKP